MNKQLSEQGINPAGFKIPQVITILIAFHLSGFRNFKHFYLNYIQDLLKSEFPQTVSYNRFVELEQKVQLPMIIFLKLMRLGTCTGISFVDSSPSGFAITSGSSIKKFLMVLPPVENPPWDTSSALSYTLLSVKREIF